MISRLELEIDRWIARVTGSWTSADTVVLVVAVGFAVCWAEAILWNIRIVVKVLKDRLYPGE